MTGSMPGESLHVNQKLTDLVSRLQPAFGEQLVSVILYGSAAAGDYDEQGSDFNVLCVLRQVTPHELVQSEPVFRWWAEQRNPPPLLLSALEVEQSTDSFPIEFSDLLQQRRVLFGEDVVAPLSVDRAFYRAQVEHELRSKQIRLRQKAAETLSNSERLLRLMTDSISTFCVLGRHALILNGEPARWKKLDVVAGLEDALVRRLPAFQELLALRATPKQKTQSDAGALFGAYLREIEGLVRFVDGLDRAKV